MRRIETRVLKLKYLPPVGFVTLLGDPTYNIQQPAAADAKAALRGRTLVPLGIESLSPDNLTQALIAQGDPKALDELEALIRLLDIRPREVTLTFSVDSSTAIVQAINNTVARLTVVSQGKLYMLDATPHINGDSSVTLFLAIVAPDTLSVLEPNGSALKTFRRVRTGESIPLQWGNALVRLTAVPQPRT